MYANGRQHAQFIANEDVEEQGDDERGHQTAPFDAHVLFHQVSQPVDEHLHHILHPRGNELTLARSSRYNKDNNNHRNPGHIQRLHMNGGT